MELKIEIPAKVEYMRIKHLPFFNEITKYNEKEPTIGDITRMNALFTGHPLVQLRRFGDKQNREVFRAILKAVGTYKQSPIPLNLEFPNPQYDKKKDESEDNQKMITYEFIKDFTQLPVDWFMDWDLIEIEENPIEMLGFSYIEKGMEYNQPDAHENALNPRPERNAIFAEHCPLNVYLDVNAFFLASWSVLQQLSMEVKS